MGRWKTSQQFQSDHSPHVYGGHANGPLRNHPKPFTSKQKHKRITPMGWCKSNGCRYAIRKKRSIFIPETICFPSMEGKPKNTFVWTSEKVSHSIQGVFENVMFLISFSTRRIKPKNTVVWISKRKSTTPTDHGGLSQRTLKFSSSKTRMQCPFHPIDRRDNDTSSFYHKTNKPQNMRITPMY